MRVLEWDDFIAGTAGAGDRPLALTVGVFDGVHRGHRALLERIVSVEGALSTVVTFKQNPLRMLRPQSYGGDIFSLEQKLETLEALGVGQAVLIDFSEHFSTINGRDFVYLLLNSRPVTILALGPDFRCGYRMDTGAGEIKALAGGVAVWTAGPVMEGGEPVSSSRIRQAIAGGELAEAEKLLGRPVELDLAGLPSSVSSPPESGGPRLFRAAGAYRIVPPAGAYKAVVYGDGPAAPETVISVTDGAVVIPGGVMRNPRRIVLLHRTQ